MTTHICINILYGAAFVADDDRFRAKAAACKVLEARGIDPVEAYAAYRRYMSDEEYFPSPRNTALIATWGAAEKAANLALTEGWYNPDGAFCTLST